MAKRTTDTSDEPALAGDLVSLGRIVHVVEANPLKDDPGAPQTFDRAAIVTVLHPDPNPDERVDVTVFTPGGPVVVVNVAHLEPPAAEKDEPPPAATPGTWHWPARVPSA